MEKKLIIFASVAFLVLIAGYLTFNWMINYNLENNEEYVQEYCSSWASRNKMIIAACLGEWTREEGKCVWKCSTTEPINNEPLIGGCSGVHIDYRQECCENWADENEIMRPMCVGNWIIDENNSCAWKCSTTESDFCGTSTNAECNLDSDCNAGGCSSQVCAGVDEDITTTCEYRECYNADLYGLSCGCVNNSCSWN